MPNKQFPLDERTSLTIYKRKGSRSLRLTIDPKGQPRLSMPYWTPYAIGIEFARSRLDWIHAQQQPKELFASGQLIGKAHRLRFIASPQVKPTSRIVGGEVRISYPSGVPIDAPSVQQVAEKACIRCLRLQAERLLPQRLETLANQHGFHYRSVAIKQLKGRWGSCDQDQNIVLNLYLMQLPWEYIDYVLLHELTHTNVLKHGPDFWEALLSVLPKAKELKKAVHAYRPQVVPIAGIANSD